MSVCRAVSCRAWWNEMSPPYCSCYCCCCPVDRKWINTTELLLSLSQKETKRKERETDRQTCCLSFFFFRCDTNDDDDGFFFFFIIIIFIQDNREGKKEVFVFPLTRKRDSTPTFLLLHLLLLMIGKFIFTIWMLSGKKRKSLADTLIPPSLSLSLLALI